MDAADSRDHRSLPTPGVPDGSIPGRTDERKGHAGRRATLSDDIDNLRRKMAEMFFREASFTADPVILISRQLDVKINEYMRQSQIGRKKAR